MADASERFPPLYYPESVEDLLTAPILGRLMLGFTLGMESVPVALEDRTKRYDLWIEPKKYWSDFCRELRGESGCNEKCEEWDRYVTEVLMGLRHDVSREEAKILRKPFECHAHMLDLAEPIRLRNRPFAVLHGGQIKPTDVAHQERMRARLKELLGPRNERIEELIELAETDPKASVSPDQIQQRDRRFRQFAREVEDLLNKLYNERRRASEDRVLGGVIEALSEAPTRDWPAWWDELSHVLFWVCKACRLDRIGFLLGSVDHRFELGVRAASRMDRWGKRKVEIRQQWQELKRKALRLEGSGWMKTFRDSLGIVKSDPCVVVATDCRAGDPPLAMPALIVSVGAENETPGMRVFMGRLIEEIGNRVSATSRIIELEQVRRAAAQFGAFGGHSVKFPLHAAVNQAEAMVSALARHRIPIEELHELARKLKGSLTQAVDRASALEKLPVTEMVIECDLKRMDILPLIEKTVKTARDIEPNKGITVTWHESPQDTVCLDADERYLAEAIDVIFENAVKYSFARREVRVFGRLESDGFVLEVSNFGVGIPPEKMLDIFELGKRAKVEEEHHGRRRSGAGLGLPIARRIVEAHRGILTLTSQPPRGVVPDHDDYRSHKVTATIKLPLPVGE